MTLEKAVHTALDAVRMQMPGTQVLFGFQRYWCEVLPRVACADGACDTPSGERRRDETPFLSD